RQVPVVREQANVLLVGIVVQVLDAVGVEARGPAHDAVDLVALLEKQLGQIRAVLAGDPSDQGRFSLCVRGHRSANIGGPWWTRPLPRLTYVASFCLIRRSLASSGRDTPGILRRTCPTHATARLRSWPAGAMMRSRVHPRARRGAPGRFRSYRPRS